LTATAGTTWSFCNQDAPPFLIVQRDSRVFIKVATLPESSYIPNWRNVRIADARPSWLYVFRGQSTAPPPFFDFPDPVYQLQLPYASRDAEVLDVNEDGAPDLYVVQVDESAGEDVLRLRRTGDTPTRGGAEESSPPSGGPRPRTGRATCCCWGRNDLWGAPPHSPRSQCSTPNRGAARSCTDWTIGPWCWAKDRMRRPHADSLMGVS
jgi:hypothetical protein